MSSKQMRYLDAADIDALVGEARDAPRRRKNLNLHPVLADPIQRLLNAGEPDTYVRPHRHASDRWEVIVPLRGRIDAVLLDDNGRITERFAVPAGGSLIEVPGGQWHSFVFAVPGSVVFEVKPGPYDAATDKEFAAWAPTDEDPAAVLCRDWLKTAPVGARFRAP